MYYLRLDSHLIPLSLRRPWLAVLLIVTLHVASHVTLAQSENEASPTLPKVAMSNKIASVVPSPARDSSEVAMNSAKTISNKNSAAMMSPTSNSSEVAFRPEKTMANEIVAVVASTTRNSYLEDVAVVIERNKVSCPATHATEADLLNAHIEELSAQLEKSSSTSHAISECQKELSRVIADKNATINRMEGAYMRTLNETYSELDRLEEKTKKQDRQFKSTEDRYQETRKKLVEADAELRRMHICAANQYVNFTLIREDAWNGIARRYANAARDVERRWGRSARMRMQGFKRKWKKTYMEKNSQVQQKLAPFKRSAHAKWKQSTFVRPRLCSLWKTLTGAAREVYRPFEPAVEEAKVAFRLSIISAIEETSKGILGYLEKDDRLKQERERERSKGSSVLQRKLEYKRRNRNRRKGDQNYEEFIPKKNKEPFLFNLKAIDLCKYALTNAAKIYEDSVATLPLAVALSLSCNMIVGGVGCLFCFLGIPTQLIWAFVILQFIKRRRMFSRLHPNLLITNED